MTVVPDWAGLARRISGELLTAESPEYDGARKPFIARYDAVLPRAVARCGCASDVVEVITFARQHNAALAVRCGGHSLAGFSSTSGILVDVSRMDRVTVSNGLAEVGAGTRLDEMYRRLLVDGVTVPAGTCPSVGIAGLTLGGGFGLLGRAQGLTLDQLVAATVVLSDGRVIECAEDSDPDMFWALRGAGAGQFGIVTSFRFRVLAAPAPMTNFTLEWPFGSAASVLGAWQAWAPFAPDELCGELQLSASGDPSEDPSVHLQGASVAGASDVGHELGEFVAGRVRPSRGRVAELSYRETIEFHGSASVTAEVVDGQSTRQGYRITKSEFFARPLPFSEAVKLVTTLGGARRPGEARSLDIAPWGGAYNRRPRDATAFCHRDQLFLIEHSALLAADPPPAARAAAKDWVRRSWASVHGSSSGQVYPCFQDPELEVWDHAYFAENVSRLRAVKARYDPDGFFRFS